MILCEGLTKTYSKRRVLDHIDVAIGPGVCALLGANGAGKSTLLRILSGLEAPDAGAVTVLGMGYRSEGIAIKRRMGVVPEGLGLFESLTVLENLLAIGPIYGLTAEETEQRAGDLLEMLELRQGRNTVARACSFGMRKKTALAMALIYRPSVLLLDEPFEGIDPSSSMTIRRMLRGLAEDGATVLLTSHILPVVETTADRVLILHKGRMALDLRPGESVTGVEEAYFGTVGRPERESPQWLRS